VNNLTANDQLPSAQEIALRCSEIDEYTPLGQLAASAQMYGTGEPLAGKNISGVWLHGWQRQIFNAQIAAFLGIELP
jgi:hypothetical protein